jgi:hypothetical protein
MIHTWVSAALMTDGPGWVQTIRRIHERDLKRLPTDNEYAQHLAWILEQRDGGWDDRKITAFVRGLDEYRLLQEAQ